SPVKPGTDPDNECTDEGATSCKQDGLCDGARGCQKYAVGTVCAVASCAGPSSGNATHTCDSTNTCVDSGTRPCASGYACVGTSCKTSCAVDTDCVSGYICSSGQCLRSNGQTCGGNSACASGFCVDGFCCNEACTGACRACSAAKKGSGT